MHDTAINGCLNSNGGYSYKMATGRVFQGIYQGTAPLGQDTTRLSQTRVTTACIDSWTGTTGSSMIANREFGFHELPLNGQPIDLTRRRRPVREHGRRKLHTERLLPAGFGCREQCLRQREARLLHGRRRGVLSLRRDARIERWRDATTGRRARDSLGPVIFADGHFRRGPLDHDR